MGWNWDNDPVVKGVRATEAWMNDPVHSTSEEPPSYLAVAGNAAAKGVAGLPDSIINVAVPPFLRSDSTQNPVRRGMESIGLIRPENEPQTPGQRILDMAVQAGVGTAIAPAAGIAGVARNAAVGLLSGTAAGGTKELTGSDLAATAVGIAVPVGIGAVRSKANMPILNNPVRKATLQDAQAAGLKVVPSHVKPSALTNKLESMGGKAAVKQQIQAENTEKIDELARKAIGLPSGEPITKEAIEKVRDVASKPYQEVEALRSTISMPWFPRFHSTSLLEELKQARANATQRFNQYNVNKDPATLAQAKSYRTEAESIEKDIERIAKASGKPELVKELKDARQLYARTYDVERAMNFADGHVNPAVFASLFRKGKPLTGELSVIGRFAAAFPESVRESARIPTAGVSGTEAGMSAVLGTMGYGAAGGPVGLVAAGLPLLRGPARAALISKGYQNRLLKQPPELNQALLRSILAGRSIAEAQP